MFDDDEITKDVLFSLLHFTGKQGDQKPDELKAEVKLAEEKPTSAEGAIRKAVTTLLPVRITQREPRAQNSRLKEQFFLNESVSNKI